MVAIIFFASRNSEGSVVLEVGDYKVNQQDYDAYMKDANDFGLSKKAARESLIEYYRVRSAAESTGLTFPKEDNSIISEMVYTEYGVSGDDRGRPYIKSAVYKKKVENVLATLSFDGYVTSVYTGKYYSDGHGAYTRDRVESYLSSIQKGLRDGSLKDSEVSHKITRDNMYNNIARYSGFITAEGEWIDSDGTRATRNVSVPVEQLLQYLKDTGEATGEIKVVDGAEVAFFAHTMRLSEGESSKVGEYNNKKEVVRVVKYDE